MNGAKIILKHLSVEDEFFLAFQLEDSCNCKVHSHSFHESFKNEKSDAAKFNLVYENLLLFRSKKNSEELSGVEVFPLFLEDSQVFF